MATPGSEPARGPAPRRFSAGLSTPQRHEEVKERAGAEAGTAGSVLTDTWPRLDISDGPLAAATTAVSGTAVVTEVTDVPPDEFDLRTLRLADYPGWGEG